MGAWKGQVDTRRRRHRRASASTFQPPVLGRPLFNERVIKRKEKKHIFTIDFPGISLGGTDATNSLSFTFLIFFFGV